MNILELNADDSMAFANWQRDFNHLVDFEPCIDERLHTLLEIFNEIESYKQFSNPITYRVMLLLQGIVLRATYCTIDEDISPYVTQFNEICKRSRRGWLISEILHHEYFTQAPPLISQTRKGSA